MSQTDLTHQETEAIDFALEYLNLHDEDITTFRETRGNGTDPVVQNRKAFRELVEKVVNCVGGYLCKAENINSSAISEFKNLTLGDLIEIKKKLS